MSAKVVKNSNSPPTNESVINIYFEGRFLATEVYELHEYNNGTIDLIFNAKSSADTRWKMLIMLSKSGLFDNASVMIFIEGITKEFAIMLKGLLLSSAKSTNLAYVDHYDMTQYIDMSKIDIGQTTVQQSSDLKVLDGYKQPPSDLKVLDPNLHSKLALCDEEKCIIDRSNSVMLMESTGLEKQGDRILFKPAEPLSDLSDFDKLIEIIRTKKLAMPNFAKVDRYAIKRQTNWIRSMLGKKPKDLPETDALKIIDRLRYLDLDSLKKSP